ncbi:hypothetical protein CYMTET_27779, partial [Cymbomonas tetramitiformis]
EGYARIGGTHQHDVWEHCHTNSLPPFEVPFFQATPLADESPRSTIVSAPAASTSAKASNVSSSPMLAAPQGADAPPKASNVSSAAVPITVLPYSNESATTRADARLLETKATDSLQATALAEDPPGGGCSLSCDRYDFVIYARCGSVAAAALPPALRGCIRVENSVNQGQAVSVLYRHLVEKYEGGLHAVTVYVPGSPDCGAHSDCDAEPLSQCKCLQAFLESLAQVDVARTAFMTLNHKILTTRSTSWMDICDVIGNFTGTPNHTQACQTGELSWINTMRDMIAVSKAQVLTQPKAVYQHLFTALDLQAGHGARWWANVEERTNGLLFNCAPRGWLRNDSSAGGACVDWGPKWCDCVNSKLKHSVPAPPCKCSISQSGAPPLASDSSATPSTDCMNYMCELGENVGAG